MAKKKVRFKAETIAEAITLDYDEILGKKRRMKRVGKFLGYLFDKNVECRNLPMLPIMLSRCRKFLEEHWKHYDKFADAFGVDSIGSPRVQKDKRWKRALAGLEQFLKKKYLPVPVMT